MGIPMLADGGGALIAGFGAIWLVLVIVGLLLSVFWLWMLIDAISSSLPSNEKLLWVLVILFTHIIGAALYYFIGRKGSGRSLAA